VAVPIEAQQGGGQALPGIDTSRQWRLERIGANHWRLVGDVEIERGDIKIFADEMELATDTNMLTARGNVVLRTPTQHIAADWLEFNTNTKLGTFHHASGSARLQSQPVERSEFGTQEPDILFYGETIEKIGDKKYRITGGGFTTCLQPTPRWQLTSGTVILNLDHYAVLKNSLLRVKGVPVLYLPVVYYPINKEDRATGFLLPMYGSSSLRGHTLSNAFFWAVSRSQDATFMYDWFSKTGHGYGTEYRYVLSRNSRGDARFYRLSERPLDYADPVSGRRVLLGGRKSFEFRGNLTQDLPARLRGRARFDYFSDITVQQTYQTNIYDTSRRQRYLGGSVSGSWGSYSMVGSLERSQYFFSSAQSTVNGALPRISFSRGERPVGNTKLYFTLNGEYSNTVRQTISDTTTYDSGLHRVDVMPLLRFPWTKWPFLAINSSLAWRYTWWSESLDPATRAQVSQPLHRTYIDMSARLVGPVLNRIWNTPNGRYAEKIKHTIEPWVFVQRISAIDNASRIVSLDSVDSIIGKTTRITFGVNNRLYAKRRDGGAMGQAREIVNVSVRQTYYTDARASLVDPSYLTSFGGGVPRKMSAISLAARVTPTDGVNATFRAEFDPYFNAFKTLVAEGTYSYQQWLNTTTGWSQRRYIKGLPGYDDPKTQNHYLNSNTTFRFKHNRYGGTMSFSYDIFNNVFLQRRFIGYYNAQCCGFAVEYQTYNFAGITYAPGVRPPVTHDRRFNIAITLAGIGTFSNFFGALGGNLGSR
jgi:LPS-assembly protein